MPVNAVLEWGILAASLCNIILLLWLGMMVFFNAERRSWGVWLAVGALATGALFFLFHASIISQGLDHVSPGVIARWPLVWIAGFLQPCAWYVVMLWYGGYWAQPRAARHHRWHDAFLFSLTVIVGTIGLLALVYPLSPVKAYPPAALLSGPMLGSAPVLAVLYALLVCGCTGMALDILLFPAPSSQIMEDLARRRARVWLIAASLVSLVVSLLLGWLLIDVAPGQFDRAPANIPQPTWLLLVWTDLALSLLICIVIVLLGQAIVIYELFTGATLPRGGLRQQWRNIVLVGALFSALMALALVDNLPPIYSILLTAMLLAVSYALHNWRSYAERERFVSSLRPFTDGPRVTEALQPGEMPELTAGIPFRALCTGVLDTRWAYLAASGPFAALVSPMRYPETAIMPGIPTALLARCTDPRTLCLPVELGECGEAAWAVPLWSTRGLIGVLLLGEKSGGGLYTREEMEIARMAGERLIDTLAGAQMARRLMEVQRSRLTGDQFADHRTRRIIHDDILPQIHTTMLALSADPSQMATVTQLAEVHHALAAVLRDLPATATLDIAHHGVVGALRAYIERTHAGAFTEVEWRIDDAAEERMRTISPLVAEVVYSAACEAVRNAARYGRGDDTARALTLTVTLTDTVPAALLISDDGVGLAHAISSVGSGQGVLLHSAMMAIIGGAWNSDSTSGTRITLTLPVELLARA